MKNFVFAIALIMSATLLSAGNYTRANDIVTDHDSGLQWQDTAYSNADKNAYNSETTESNRAKQWIHAAAYCDDLNLDGGGWRLPAITELDAIVDKNYNNPALDHHYFINALGLGTWSGTTYPDNTSQAWGMGFDSGNRHHCTKNVKSKLIMCVRKASGTPPPSNKAPVAKAGSDQTVTEGSTVTLNGSGSSDSDGTIDAYVWKENGNVLSRKMSFDKVFAVGTHTVTLTVTDNDGATASDTVVVKVNAAAPVNKAPVAKAGSDKAVTEGEIVTLDGSASSDPDGDITAYVWKENGTVLSRKVSFDKVFGVGTHTVTLTVTDNDGATASDTVVVKVNAAAPVNKVPVAKAGSDKTATEGEIVTLDGSASSDPDGDITAYVWKENGTVLSREISFDKIFSVGTHTITLTVTDNDGATGSDTVVVAVNAANQAPIAKAGPDQTVTEGETITLDGSSSTDPEGDINAYVWKENGAVLSREISFDKIFSVGTHTITLTVTDNDAAAGTDSVTVTVTADEPDWFEETEIDGKTEYTIIGGETSVALDSGIKNDFNVKADDVMIIFTAKSPLVIGSCQVKAYITMKNDGTARAGYTHEGSGCSDDIDTFSTVTIVTVDNNGVLRIDAPITSDLVLGGK